MLDLLYLSRTVVPAHLSELDQLGILYRDEQVLVALDGVLLDARGSRMRGPTLHDYCLLTGNRVLLWARDYAEHICFAFPLSELSAVSGQGMDPLHAQLQLTFSSEGEEPQHYTLALLPLADLPMAMALFNTAAQTTRDLGPLGLSPVDAGGEVMAALSALMCGETTVPLERNPHLSNLGASPYRWPATNAASPGPTTSSLEAAPEMVYKLGRLGRSAWDALVRSLRESELPFDLNGADLRDLTAMMRAANDLLITITGSPEARETIQDLFNSTGAGLSSGDEEPEEAEETEQPGCYREIPLRRRESASPAAASWISVPRMPQVQPQVSEDLADFRGIPLRRRKRASGE